MTEPSYQDCDRCKRLKLGCKIDANFKRVGKRSRNAAMEQEIAELRAQLANQKSLEEQTSPIITTPTIKAPSEYNDSSNLRFIPTHNEIEGRCCGCFADGSCNRRRGWLFHEKPQRSAFIFQATWRRESSVQTRCKSYSTYTLRSTIHSFLCSIHSSRLRTTITRQNFFSGFWSA